MSPGADSARATVAVDLAERSYEIEVGPGLIAETGARLRTSFGDRPTLVVSDETVAALYLEPLEASLREAGLDHRAFVVAPGEGSKSFASFSGLAEKILEAGIERASLIVALGGGVVGDLAGFLAATLLRGLDFVQLPTTLLAQVDSSVGGKTAINATAGKNLIGAFHQPRLVLADTDTLNTLPRRELLAGYAETVKYGLIRDPEFFAWCEQNAEPLLAGDRGARTRAVVTACRAKAGIVGRDEREAGERALLNLGHTFGHALEAAANYSDALLHGEAVAIGMALAFDLSAALGLCRAGDAARVRRHLSAVGLPTSLDAGAFGGRLPSPESLIASMATDKKVSGGRIRFVLARGIGDAFVADDVDLGAVRDLLDRAAAA